MTTRRDATLAPQELAVMKVVWSKGSATVRDVYETLREARPLAYTTVMTTMNILETKGFLEKTRDDRAFRYTPTRSRHQVVGAMVKDFPRKSTTVLVLTDGDTVPDSGLKPMPSAVSEIIFAGVGNASRGTFIDGHLSRQDNASLSQLARRLGGHYHNGNTKQVPSEMLRRLVAPDEYEEKLKMSLRSLAIIALVSSAGVLCLLPVLLEYFGSAWKPLSKEARVEEMLRSTSEVAA